MMASRDSLAALKRVWSKCGNTITHPDGMGHTIIAGPTPGSAGAHDTEARPLASKMCAAKWPTVVDLTWSTSRMQIDLSPQAFDLIRSRGGTAAIDFIPPIG